MTQVIEHQQQDKYRQPSDSVPIDSPACDGKTELFFSERTIAMRAAQLICSTCPMKQACLSNARSNPPFAGVWGGVIFVNGQEQIFKRGRGRPSKDESEQNAKILRALGAHSLESREASSRNSDETYEKEIA